MGLDITAYSHLKPVGKHTDDWCEDDKHVNVYAYDCFPASFRGLPILGTKYGYGGTDTFFDGGCYEYTDQTQTCRFRAGSYLGYNLWRDDLRQQFNPTTEPDQPFYELIFFADNEGSIGPDAAKDLLADFRKHADRYDPKDDSGYDWMRPLYSSWMRAFELAADGGLVRFH